MVLSNNYSYNTALSELLARAYGVPVGQRWGGRLATMLVATKNDIIAKLSQAKPQLQLSWLALASLNFT